MTNETLGEAAERHIFGNTYGNFIRGAEWMAERMYSEEEVLEIVQTFNDVCERPNKPHQIKNWFEQFKKK